MSAISVNRLLSTYDNILNACNVADSQRFRLLNPASMTNEQHLQFIDRIAQVTNISLEQGRVTARVARDVHQRNKGIDAGAAQVIMSAFSQLQLAQFSRLTPQQQQKLRNLYAIVNSIIGTKIACPAFPPPEVATTPSGSSPPRAPSQTIEEPILRGPLHDVRPPSSGRVLPPKPPRVPSGPQLVSPVTTSSEEAQVRVRAESVEALPQHVTTRLQSQDVVEANNAVLTASNLVTTTRSGLPSIPQARTSDAANTALTQAEQAGVSARSDFLTAVTPPSYLVDLRTQIGTTRDARTAGETTFLNIQEIDNALRAKLQAISNKKNTVDQLVMRISSLSTTPSERQTARTELPAALQALREEIGAPVVVNGQSRSLADTRIALEQAISDLNQHRQTVDGAVTQLNIFTRTAQDSVELVARSRAWGLFTEGQLQTQAETAVAAAASALERLNTTILQTEVPTLTTTPTLIDYTSNTLWGTAAEHVAKRELAITNQQRAESKRATVANLVTSTTANQTVNSLTTAISEAEAAQTAAQRYADAAEQAYEAALQRYNTAEVLPEAIERLSNYQSDVRRASELEELVRSRLEEKKRLVEENRDTIRATREQIEQLIARIPNLSGTARTDAHSQLNDLTTRLQEAMNETQARTVALQSARDKVTACRERTSISIADYMHAIRTTRTNAGTSMNTARRAAEAAQQAATDISGYIATLRTRLTQAQQAEAAARTAQQAQEGEALWRASQRGMDMPPSRPHEQPVTHEEFRNLQPNDVSTVCARIIANRQSINNFTRDDILACSQVSKLELATAFVNSTTDFPHRSEWIARLYYRALEHPLAEQNIAEFARVAGQLAIHQGNIDLNWPATLLFFSSRVDRIPQEKRQDYVNALLCIPKLRTAIMDRCQQVISQPTADNLLFLRTMAPYCSTLFQGQTIDVASVTDGLVRNEIGQLFLGMGATVQGRRTVPPPPPRMVPPPPRQVPSPPTPSVTATTQPPLQAASITVTPTTIVGRINAALNNPETTAQSLRELIAVPVEEGMRLNYKAIVARLTPVMKQALFTELCNNIDPQNPNENIERFLFEIAGEMKQPAQMSALITLMADMTSAHLNLLYESTSRNTFLRNPYFNRNLFANTTVVIPANIENRDHIADILRFYGAVTRSAALAERSQVVAEVRQHGQLPQVLRAAVSTANATDIVNTIRNNQITSESLPANFSSIINNPGLLTEVLDGLRGALSAVSDAERSRINGIITHLETRRAPPIQGRRAVVRQRGARTQMPRFIPKPPTPPQPQDTQPPTTSTS